MKKFSVIMLMILLLSSFIVYGSHEQNFIEEGKFSISGTVKDEYNEGMFPIDEGIKGVFQLESEEVTASNYSVYFIKDTGEEYLCLSYILSNANDTINDRCTVYVNSTGWYTGVLRIDDRNIYVEAIKVTDASPSTLFWVLIGVGVLIGIIALTVFKPLLLLSVVLLLGAFTDLLFTYKYVVSDDLFVGLVGIIILGLIIAILFLFKNYIE